MCYVSNIYIFLINTQSQIKVKIIQKIKTQDLQFALRSLYDSQKESKSNNKSKQKNTNIDI